ncbi:DUF975 family protein [Lacrimispora saccharolytica]|uniref:DUF975 family protein n=1 Tax=Lacrimispora saccharolytica (strain ATCC 35040 / DSM 2544 / NRCC 2533 / WM1) TaxID=610130 RepID=D9R3G0_LACSW|nr:DUF975 family protein [Lacrimispora saccharolytica]ADL04909.1 protein of unknown function DUF975 [[Clostridium] saccharolyticum WM1]QRV20884.1 DUF975 family protein [Lacrimispora saccharolytica]
MKTSSSELKRRARRSLKGRYGLCIGVQFLACAVLLAASLVYVLTSYSLGLVQNPFFEGSLTISPGYVALRGGIYLSFLVILSVYGLLMPGILKIYLNMSTGNSAGLSDLFFAFQNKPHKFLGLYFINILIGFIWAVPYFVVLIVAVVTDFIPVMVVLLVLTYLLLLIGSTVTMLCLSQSMFILIESPDQRLWKCLKKSAEMMKGNKGGLFYILLSFLGIIILGYCSLGIGFLWILPYIYATMTEYYLDLKDRFPHNSLIGDEEAFSQSAWNRENQW